MKISVIIPIYNSADTLEDSLRSVFSSSVKPFEVIVVDDTSIDKGAEIAKQFPVKLISLEKNHGSGYARNVAVDSSSGEILLFIDADVMVKKNTLGIVMDSFSNDAELDAIIGLFSKEHPNKNFFSQYKNLYMHFAFSRICGYVDFLFTSICAIRKEAYLSFSQTRLKADDTEAGQRYKIANRKIALNRDLEVIHLKAYNFISFIKNDFIIPYDWSRIFLKYRGINHLTRYGGFAHAKLNQIASLIISPIVLLNFMTLKFWPQNTILVYMLLGMFLALNTPFFKFLYKEKGTVFMLKSLIVTYIDMLVMGAGILSGALSYLFIREKRIQ
jgi:glycosyltransferase involved in cell wall biosynthesis